MEVGFGVPQVGRAVTADTIRIVAQRCEDLGYRTLWSLERIIRPLDPQTRYNAARRPDGTFHEQYGQVFDPFETLTWAAAFTSRIRLGTSVVVLPFHSPVDVARRAATLDHLSGGRLDLGVGSGWSKDEYDAAGTPFERKAGRMNEYFQVLHKLWGPDPVEHHGEFYAVPLSDVNPKPLQDPLPVYYATNGALGFRMLAKYCQGWNPQRMTPRQMQEHRELLGSMIADAGRDPSALRIAYRVTLPIIVDPPPGERMPFRGPIEEFPDDLAALAEAGVDEVHFDVGFLDEVTSADAYIRWAERLRGCWP